MYANPGAASASVEDHWVADNISVYPNPATSLVTIASPDISGRVDASIISSRGTVVWHNFATSENGRLQLDLSKLPAGAYTVALRTATTQKLCRVVLER